MTTEATIAVAATIEALQVGWNSADGSKFAEPFTDDADFVAIRGDHHKGKTVIAKGHDAIFATIYSGSRIKYEVVAARHLTEQVILGHVKGTLTAPTGPLAGVQVALASVVLVRSGAKWQIAAFHNTLMTQSPIPQRGAAA